METTHFWRSLRGPGILLAALFTGFVLYVLQTQHLLPERVASHFGPDGLPNDWMNRSSLVTFMLILCLCLVLLMVIASLITRYIPPEYVNIPNRDYWLAPERRLESSIFVSRYLLWLACMEVIFLAVTHSLTIMANRSVPVQLPGKAFAALVVVFTVGMVIWAILLIRRFRKPSAGQVEQ